MPGAVVAAGAALLLVGFLGVQLLGDDEDPATGRPGSTQDSPSGPQAAATSPAASPETFPSHSDVPPAAFPGLAHGAAGRPGRHGAGPHAGDGPLGALVVVDRADGSHVRFRMTRLERMLKTAFPTREVYLPTAGPELWLVTCGGSFAAATRHYRGMVITYAGLPA